MQDSARPSLKDCLVSNAEDESPPLKGTQEVEYIVLRRVKPRKSHVYVEYVDGDERDGFEWFEGPVPVYMTIGALFGVREERNREERREMYGRERLGEGKTRPEPRKITLRARDEKITKTCDKESVKEKGESHESTCVSVTDGSPCSGSQSSLGTRQKLSREIGAKKRAKTCPDMRKSKVDQVDSESRE